MKEKDYIKDRMSLNSTYEFDIIAGGDLYE
jgi:hypothetical protein